MSQPGRGVVLLSASSARAVEWVRRGVVPCHVVEHSAWSIVVTASATSAAAQPYDDALTVLASRHAGPRLTPTIGLFVIVSAFILTGIYVAKANTSFDQINEEILREFE